MKKLISLLLCLLIISGLTPVAFAAGDDDRSADFIYSTVTNPRVGSVGGEWAIIGLARSDCQVPAEYYQKYYEAVEKQLTKNKGVLHNKKHTEYSRVILALTAIGKNPKNVAGYNLLEPLGDYEKTVWQGVNGPIWALIALDSKNYEIPQNPTAKVQATREMYVNCILDKQLSDGGWGLGNQTEPDITAMALQALSKYSDNEKVNTAIEKALTYMSEMQDNDAGYYCMEKNSSESTAQMIVALCELGIPINDQRFVKNGNTLLDNLKSYSLPEGGYKHTYDSEYYDLMASEQALYALVALDRFYNGKNSLYSMTDVKVSSDSERVSQWAVSSLAFCYNQKAMEIKPKESIKRGEIALMLFNILKSANQEK